MPKHQQKTILQVVPSLMSGGVERGTIDVAKALVDNNFRSLVISSGGSLVHNLEKYGSEHIKMRVNSKSPITIYKNHLSIADIINKENVDLIHARSRAPAWSAYAAARKTEARFVTTFHGIYNFSTKLKKIYNSVMVKGERVIAVSNFVKEHIIENYNAIEENIRVIHRGVDYNHFDPSNFTDSLKDKFKDKYHISKDIPIILLPARMTSWKGHMVLIDALNLIRNKDFRCLIVGDLSKHPNFNKRVHEKISELKLQSKVKVFGPENDMMSLYGFSDLVVSASIEPEAFGRVVIEAQSMEKLVIASNIGGSAETIKDESTGFHVNPGDAVDLSEKISHAIEMLGTTKAEKIQKAARNSVKKHFSLEQMTSKTLDVYKELI
ncbi:MAG: glycosyltransferase family 4 protein [Rickettsiaceae bacterium]|nr:glycosyltransferase family 4 protein [Rickettsiaceae bacterium]